MPTDINVPPLGESVPEATVSRWVKKVGDSVAAGEIIAELETDKATLEVPSPSAGVIASHAANEGETVAANAKLATLDEGAAAASEAAPAAKKESAPAPAKESSAPASGGGASVDIAVPPLGESVAEATVSRWVKNPGDAVAAGEIIAELETDKATLEVPAPSAGVLESQAVKGGETITANAKLATMKSGGGAAASSAPAASAPAPAKTQTPAHQHKETTASAAQANGGGQAHPLSPAVRRLVDEHNLNPAAIPATGKDGRITKGDVLAAIESGGAKDARAVATATTSTTAAPPRETGPREERVPMTRLRRVIAERLKHAQNTAAMLTTFNEADMSAVMAMRGQYKEAFEKSYGIGLGFMSFFVSAAVAALREFPAVNAEIAGDDIIYKNYYNIGVAVGTPQGLVVPVLKDADAMSFAETESAIAAFGKKARDGQLSMEDMSGGTFTISNGGVYGSMMSTPILNPPQSGILGMHNIVKRAVVVGDAIEIRPMMYLALSYDHRIIDGREAVSFLARIKAAIEDPRRMLIGL